MQSLMENLLSEIKFTKEPKKKRSEQRVPRPYRCEACHPLYFLAQQVCEYFSNNSSWLCFI